MTTPHLFTAVNPELELAFDDIKRRRPLPLSVLEALDGRHMLEQRARAMDLYKASLTTQVKANFHQKALELHAKVESKADEMLHRARVRSAIAHKLEGEVAAEGRKQRGYAGWLEYITLAQKLRDARGFGVYGVDAVEAWLDEGKDVDPEIFWTNRAGLVKLCPDDARWEGRRVGRIYGERLKALDQLGYVLRYAVFTLPNFPQWHLRSGLDAIRKLFYKKIFYAGRNGVVVKSWRDKRRLFPDLVGALCTIEAPLSGLYSEDPSNAWNVHLNVIMVFRPSSDQPYGRPDYKPLRDAWGAHVHFEEIPQGDADATRAALKELVKYPLRAVSEKSAEDRKPKRDHEGNLLPAPPPLIEWPAEYIDEWWQSHKGLRRTWSCGELYDNKIEALDGAVIELPKIASRNRENFEPIGPVWLSPTECYVLPPMIDTREIDAERKRRKTEHSMRLATDPQYAAKCRETARLRDAGEEHQRRRQAARAALFTFIQGNISAARDAMVVGEFFRAARGPP